MEWVEQHEKELTERAVIYLNTDTVVSGKYVLIPSGSPLVKDTILDFSKTVNDPNAHDDKETIFDIMLERMPSRNDPSKPSVGNLGSGSDYAAFYQFVGVPSADFYYIFGFKDMPIYYPVYHSQHDTFNWIKKFVDPDFKLHKAVTQLTGGLLIQFADAPLLPMSVTLYAAALSESLIALKNAYKDKLQSHAKSLGYLEDAVKQFHETAIKFTATRYVCMYTHEIISCFFGKIQIYGFLYPKTDFAFLYSNPEKDYESEQSTIRADSFLGFMIRAFLCESKGFQKVRWSTVFTVNSL